MIRGDLDISTPSWHRFAATDVLARLDTSPDGLSVAEAAERLLRDGPNELEDRGSKHPLRIVWEQISAVMVLILIGAALLSLALGKLLEAGAIGAIVILFSVLGFLQEYRAEQAIAALRRMSVPNVRVVRDGRSTESPSVELVSGDVVQIEAGSVVPADLRLLDAINLRVQESALTGESEPVDKQPAAIDVDDLTLGDRRCMAYSGTQVTYGRGTGVVVATGMATELGRIATLLQGVAVERTPLQDRLDRVGKQLAFAGLVVAALVVAMGAVAGESAGDLVLTAISVAVAVIPEGLPAVVTFTLAIGAKRMLRRNALIRKLPAVETLGSVTVICSDKTGTLTQNRMTVTVLDVADHRVRLDEVPLHRTLAERPPAVALTLAAGLLCNDGELHVLDDVLDTATGDGGGNGSAVTSVGDPTETALLHAAHDAGIDVIGLRRAAPRTGERPFDSDRKRMSTVHGPLDGRVPALAPLPQDAPLAFVKGAIDGLLDHASHVWQESGAVALDHEWRERIAAANQTMASEGMRVLGVAYRALPDADALDIAEEDLTIIGLVGIIDPPREEVRDAVATCRAAGIRPIMITGDHPLTARAIARDLGIGDSDRTLTGAELEHLDDVALDTALQEVSVFARVSPEHKLRIVRVAAAAGSRRGDDRRRRQRRSRSQTCRHRRRDGDHRYRRVEGSGRHGAARRQLRDDRGGRRGGPGDLRQPAPLRQLRRRRQPREDHRDARLADPLPALGRSGRRRRSRSCRSSSCG